MRSIELEPSFSGSRLRLTEAPGSRFCDGESATCTVLETHQSILELLAEGGPLDRALDRLARMIEVKSENGAHASILLLDATGTSLRCVSAPSLPDAYITALAGLPVREGAGATPCGMAACRGERVVVSDIAVDPLVDGFRELLLGYGLRACWSAPIAAPGGGVLGTFALYYDRVAIPDEGDLELVEIATRTAAAMIAWDRLYEAELVGRSKLERLIERLHEGVVSVDRRVCVEFASERAKELLHTVSLEEGRKVPETWSGFPLRRFAAGLFESDESAVEARVVSDDGERVFELTGIPAVRSDGVLLVVTDVSGREQRRRAELEFVDNAAHELRTPLAAITSAIERLQAGAREVPEKRDRFLGHIQNESVRLNRLASSLLVLARAQSRDEQPRLEQIALRVLLEEVTDGLAPKDGVELVLDCSPDVVASSNRDLLEHALLNLTINAVRHTSRGRITVAARAAGDGSVTIEVRDTGSGMTPEQLGRLFDRFYRGPDEEGRAGFGLGLPITKEAVEAIGGRLQIDSVHGIGTTATVVLPADVLAA